MAFFGHRREKLLEGNIWKSVRCSDDPHTAGVSVYSANRYPAARCEFTHKKVLEQKRKQEKEKLGAQQMRFRELLAGLPDVR